MITEEDLNHKAKFYAKYLWNLDLDIPVKINTRLRSTHGQLYFGTYKKELQLAKHILNTGYLLDDVLLHELCHWYCHQAKIDHRDFHSPFENELERIGASSSETTEEINGKILYRYKYGVYKCEICGNKIETKDYLGEETECGRLIKEYFCCNNKMYYSGTKHIPEEFIPNEKILKIVEEYNKQIKH